MKIFPTNHPQWQNQIEQIPRIARCPFAVLLLGPSGSGKEIIAESIHQQSLREGPLIRVNCSSLAENLIESELFGHRKGSFTGAIADRKGAFESARGGTLFLDEIGDLPLSLQAKLLRALENSEIKPVGCDHTIQVDVRVVSATHHNLPQQVEQRRFRADLYYRLSVIQFFIPSLKERMVDFDIILFNFARQFQVRFSHSAIQTLKQYHWPGNIRELRNVIARASVMCEREVEAEDIRQLLLPRDGYTERPNGTLREFERDLIIHTLEQNNGNQRQTASRLGIPKSTLHDRLKSYGIDSRNFKRG